DHRVGTPADRLGGERAGGGPAPYRRGDRGACRKPTLEQADERNRHGARAGHMSNLDRQLAEDRALRNAALAVFKADLAFIRTDIRERGLGTRLADRLGE